jgi:hypothetical protein
MGYKIKYSRKEKKQNKKDKEISEIVIVPNCLLDARDVDDYVYI